VSKFKRSQAKYVKRPYRVRNWAAYESGLVARGSLTVWIDLDADADTVPGWDAVTPARPKSGRRRKYSNHAIETAVTIGLVYHLPSRQTEGFLTSLFSLLNLRADVPDHTTVSRRKRSLGKQGLSAPRNNRPIHILIDSSGLRVHAGNLRKPPTNRDWRKLHLGVDELTGDIVACELTGKRARDAARVPSLLKQTDRPIASCRADSAYDERGVYDAIENHHNRSPRVLIPPKKGARLAPNSPTSRERNRNIRARARLGKRAWHTRSGYSQRAKVETTFSRYKAVIGPAMRSRNLAAQRVEARLGSRILNTMTALGMPDSYMLT
jgi:hypothetical protein